MPDDDRVLNRLDTLGDRISHVEGNLEGLEARITHLENRADAPVQVADKEEVEDKLIGKSIKWGIKHWHWIAIIGSLLFGTTVGHKIVRAISGAPQVTADPTPIWGPFDERPGHHR